MKARLIQKIFRGYITRKHLELLHASAIIIQKNWRGFVGRRIYRAQLKVKELAKVLPEILKLTETTLAAQLQITDHEYKAI